MSDGFNFSIEYNFERNQFHCNPFVIDKDIKKRLDLFNYPTFQRDESIRAM